MQNSLLVLLRLLPGIRVLDQVFVGFFWRHPAVGDGQRFSGLIPIPDPHESDFD